MLRPRISPPTLAATAAISAALAGCAAHAPSQPADAAGPVAPAVTTVRARIGSVERTLAVPGRIGPPAGSDAKLAFPFGGIVERVFVRPGDGVVAGQTLVVLDRHALADAVAQARADADGATATYAGGSSAAASVASAEAKLDAARAHLARLRTGGPGADSDRIAAVATARQAALKVDLDRRAFERASTLFAGGVDAAKDVEAARSLLASDLADRRGAEARVAAAGAGYAAALRQANADAAQARSDLAAARAGAAAAGAQRDSAAAKLASAENDYAHAVLAAPADGIVLAVLKHPGEAVDTTTPVIDLAPPDNGEVTLSLPSDAAARVRIGDAVRLGVAATGMRSRARVTAIVPAVDSTTQAVTVVARGAVRGALAGEAIDAAIVLDRTSGVVVPVAAVVTDPGTGKSIVFVRDRASRDTPFVAREVAVRANDGTSAVVQGVRAGDEIAAQGAYDLSAPGGG
jgi:multidrug efflux pump subunit AcrA (membrane-fusion protein)